MIDLFDLIEHGQPVSIILARYLFLLVAAALLFFLTRLK